MIGETLDDSDEVAGANLTMRRGQLRFSLWTRSARNAETQVKACWTCSALWYMAVWSELIPYQHYAAYSPL
jgi:hypothetical protein